MRKILTLLTAALLMASCAPRTNTGQAVTDTFRDDYNRTVVVPTHPKRVVSTSPAVTEIIFALGADSLLVGRTDFCNYPAEAKKIESIGGISNLSIEKILSLSPDLVISGSMIPQKSADQLAAMGVPMVCVIEKQQFDGLFANILAIGSLIGSSEAAEQLVANLKARVPQVPDLDDSLPTVYYVVGFGSTGNYTAGGNTFINDIIEMAGGRNVAKDVKGWSYSVEALMDSDPDYIMIRREDSATFVRLAPYKRLSAVREGRLIPVESSTVDLQVPRNIEAVETLRQALHPNKN
ncbi:MAG: ABC transporter substrate-binding protein [Bacteroidales bacterium]|nr:ABC transporter substrate-binding protein [Bacteroidales bacterium]